MVIGLLDGPLFNFLIGVIFLTVLVIGADKMINQTIIFARRLKVSELFIGLTIVSIGTSVPEIFTAVVGSVDVLRGKLAQDVVSATILGTNLGSDVVQQSLLIGIISLIAVIPLSKKTFDRDLPFLIVTCFVLLAFLQDGLLSRIDGFILIVFYCWYLFIVWREEKKRTSKRKTPLMLSKWTIAKDLAIIFFWLGAVIVSAEEILRLSTYFVDYFHIGGSLIGVVFIGIATALPELTTSLAAVLKNSSNIGIGTLIGSNITNPAFALGIGALISPFLVPRALVWYDLPVKILMAFVLMFMVFTSRKITRREAVILIGMYLFYIVFRFIFFNADVFL